MPAELVARIAGLGGDACAAAAAEGVCRGWRAAVAGRPAAAWLPALALLDAEEASAAAAELLRDRLAAAVRSAAQAAGGAAAAPARAMAGASKGPRQIDSAAPATAAAPTDSEALRRVERVSGWSDGGALKRKTAAACLYHRAAAGSDLAAGAGAGEPPVARTNKCSMCYRPTARTPAHAWRVVLCGACSEGAGSATLSVAAARRKYGGAVDLAALTPQRLGARSGCIGAHYFVYKKRFSFNPYLNLQI